MGDFSPPDQQLSPGDEVVTTTGGGEAVVCRAPDVVRPAVVPVFGDVSSLSPPNFGAGLTAGAATNAIGAWRTGGMDSPELMGRQRCVKGDLLEAVSEAGPASGDTGVVDIDNGIVNYEWGVPFVVDDPVLDRQLRIEGMGPSLDLSGERITEISPWTAVAAAERHLAARRGGGGAGEEESRGKPVFRQLV